MVRASLMAGLGLKLGARVLLCSLLVCVSDDQLRLEVGRGCCRTSWRTLAHTYLGSAYAAQSPWTGRDPYQSGSSRTLR